MGTPAMVRIFPILDSNGKLARLRVSVPLIECLLEPGRYELEENMPPKAGRELRAQRQPRLRTLVRMAMAMQDADRTARALRERAVQ